MWIKICGIRDRAAAAAVAGLRPAALGLNFYAGSPRCISEDVAAEIVRALPAEVEPIGVFVNHSAAEIRKIAHRCGLRTIQLHGDEPVSLLAELREFRIVRAFRVDTAGLAKVAETLAACAAGDCLPWACLVDAHVPGSYGGTGQVAPWSVLREEWQADWPPLILAGGLRPENVAAAITAVQPWGVDVAGGVESAPGVKDPLRVEEFIRAARRASGSRSLK